MFTWICPKCGKEVPPAYSDCPNCAPERPADAPVAGEPANQVPAPNVTAALERPAAPPQPAAVPVAEPSVAPPPVAAQRRGGVSVPGWLLSLLIAAVLIIVGLTVVLLTRSSSNAPAPAPQAAALEKPAPAAISDSNPTFRYVELTGLRLTEDAKHKAFVQVVVVNHSAGDLGTVAATVNLKAVAKQAEEAVGTFSFKTTLGPYESKEIKAPFDTKLRVYELPDWQFLRVEIAK
jgi:hypothetical protein